VLAQCVGLHSCPIFNTIQQSEAPDSFQKEVTHLLHFYWFQFTAVHGRAARFTGAERLALAARPGAPPPSAMLRRLCGGRNAGASITALVRSAAPRCAECSTRSIRGGRMQQRATTAASASGGGDQVTAAASLLPPELSDFRPNVGMCVVNARGQVRLRQRRGAGEPAGSRKRTGVARQARCHMRHAQPPGFAPAPCQLAPATKTPV
jgi:hypothetical protein